MGRVIPFPRQPRPAHRYNADGLDRLVDELERLRRPRHAPAPTPRRHLALVLAFPSQER